MNKHTLQLLSFSAFATFSAFAFVLVQASAQDSSEIDVSDVVVIEDSNANPVEGAGESVTVVEIPEVEIEGAIIDVNAPNIPEATNTIGDTDIVLEIPGEEEQGSVKATMQNEESISVDFPDEEVRTILRNVADLFELNLVIPDALQGRLSIKLNNVSWQQLFDEVLRQVGYTYVVDRNIIRITSLDELAVEPVDTRVFIVNFARANEIQGSISPLVDAAAGGQIRVDARSNALVITERPSRMNKIQEIIERLDQPNQQVMIESKFVEVTNTDTSNVGINWAFMKGYQASAGPFDRQWADGEDTNSSTTKGLTTSTGQTSSSGFDVGTGQLSGVNSSTLQNASTFASDAAKLAATSRLDTAVFSASEFDIVLSALNESNDSELVSNPTVVTMDNTEAKIEIVTEVPQLEFEFNEETGTSRATGLAEPLKFGTELLVTPQVNAAGFINLSITPKVSNQIGVQETDFGDQPILSSRYANTNVMIKDGYTLALGGLTQNETQKNGTKVPVLGDLPGVGRFFSSKNDIETQRNLVIFITARTLNPDGSTYRDVVDPRILDKMGITPSDLPGYQLPEEQLEHLSQLEEMRTQAELSQFDQDAKSRIKQIEDVKQEAEEEHVSEPRVRAQRLSAQR